MRFIDLFAGIGGFRYGLEAVNNRKLLSGKETEGLQKNRPDPKKRQDRFACVYSNEWDKYASQIYKKHYGECDTRDIRTIRADEIPDHDLLCAGFPCQAFSVAGKRRGFEDTRGTLFFEIARIAKYKRPQYLLLENVKGLLSHEQGKTFQTIIGVLADLGYRVEWQVLNSKHFGVPQNRERVFIIGHLGGFGGRKVFPIGESERGDLSEYEERKRICSNTLKARDYKGGGNLIKETQKLSDAMRVRNIDGVSSTLKGLGGGMGAKTGLYAISKTVRAGGRGSPKGSRQEWDIVGGIRRLTPTECERLQGFLDGWTEGVSDTQRYRQLGNAVTTTVITEIGKKLISCCQ